MTTVDLIVLSSFVALLVFGIAIGLVYVHQQKCQTRELRAERERIESGQPF